MVMGHFFSFNVSEKTTDTLMGKYNPPINEKIVPSWYGMKNPGPTKEKVSGLYDGNTTGIYILGLKYRGKKGRPNDSQPTITGKTKGDESFKEGALREIGEEVGALCELSMIKPLISFDGTTEIHTFVLKVSEITPLQKIPAPSTASDNHNRRVEIVLCGTIEQFETALAEITLRSNEETDIMGVMAYPLEHAK